jgi:hypothetical protein
MSAPAPERIIVHEADLLSPIERGRHIRAYCHIHGGEHQRSLSINSKNGFGECFACHARVFVPEFNPDGEMRKRGPITAASLLRPVAPKPLVEATPEPWQIEELQALSQAADRMRARLDDDRPRAYLEGRGIPLDVAEAAGVGYVPDMTLPGPLSKWRDRLIFPLGSPAGLGYAGRSLWGWQPGMDEDEHKKILDADGAPKRWRKTYPAGYFGYDQLVEESAVIVEGPVDALALMTSGLLDMPILALVGTACRAEHLPAGLREVVLALDGDASGIERSRALARDMATTGLIVACVAPPDDGQGKDWSARWRINRHTGVWPVSEALDQLSPGAPPEADLTADSQLDATPETEIPLEIPTGWVRFHSTLCGSSPDGWAEFARLRATPTGPSLCIHCGAPHAIA